MTAPRVTAVVLNWCNEHDTIECLDSLERQHYPALTILLVDNGSHDGSGARLHARYPAISFLQTGENLGYAGGNNSGMKQALDAPEKIWFGGGRFDRLRAIGRHERANQVDLDPAERQLIEATFLTGCCLLIPAATLRTVGYFRDDFFAYLEDVEFGLRIMKSGYRLLLAPAARLRHKVPPLGSSPAPIQIHLRDRNRRRIVRSHYSLFDALRFATWFYPTRVALMVTYGLRGDAARVRGTLRGMIEA